MRLLSRFICISTLILWAAPGSSAASTELVTNAPASLHNVFRLTPSLLSGSQPEGDAAFAWLAAQGVKSIVSVDGSRPDVEAARRHGLRYVHLPIGYDGVPTNRVIELAKAAADLPGPIYVHCHHGKHRGPAAAALMCQSRARWAPSEAEAFLKQAGTSPDYPGLYRSVQEFKAPSAEALSQLREPLPEVARTPGIVQAMVAIDEHCERLRACQKNGWKSPPDHPDIAPAHEAVQLWEQYLELQRADETRARPADFREMLQASERAADELRSHLGKGATSPPGNDPLADSVFRRITEQCARCHKQHRN